VAAGCWWPCRGASDEHAAPAGDRADHLRKPRRRGGAAPRPGARFETVLSRIPAAIFAGLATATLLGGAARWPARPSWARPPARWWRRRRAPCCSAGGWRDRLRGGRARGLSASGTVRGPYTGSGPQAAGVESGRLCHGDEGPSGVPPPEGVDVAYPPVHDHSLLTVDSNRS